MVIIVICLFTGKKMFKAKNKNVNFLSKFSLGNISNKFDYVKSEEVSLKGNVYDFSIEYNAIDKSNILSMQKYLMVKNNVNYVWTY